MSGQAEDAPSHLNNFFNFPWVYIGMSPVSRLWLLFNPLLDPPVLAKRVIAEGTEKKAGPQIDANTRPPLPEHFFFAHVHPF